MSEKEIERHNGGDVVHIHMENQYCNVRYQLKVDMKKARGTRKSDPSSDVSPAAKIRARPTPSTGLRFVCTEYGEAALVGTGDSRLESVAIAGTCRLNRDVIGAQQLPNLEPMVNALLMDISKVLTKEEFDAIKTFLLVHHQLEWFKSHGPKLPKAVCIRET